MKKKHDYEIEERESPYWPAVDDGRVELPKVERLGSNPVCDDGVAGGFRKEKQGSSDLQRDPQGYD